MYNLLRRSCEGRGIYAKSWHHVFKGWIQKEQSRKGCFKKCCIFCLTRAMMKILLDCWITPTGWESCFCRIQICCWGCSQLLLLLILTASPSCLLSAVLGYLAALTMNSGFSAPLCSFMWCMCMWLAHPGSLMLFVCSHRPVMIYSRAGFSLLPAHMVSNPPSHTLCPPTA